MIVLYKGSRGKGKSLTMVKDGLKYLNDGWRVLTNLDNTPFEKVTSEYILNLSCTSDLFHVILLIDEVELFFDSREWKKEDSKKFSKFLQQIRKRGVHILCTAQFSDLIEKRLRQQVDLVCQCDFDKKSFIASGLYVDLTSLESGEINSFFVEYYAKPIFQLYDTNQIILV